MGKSGPKLKPTALRELHGDRKDRINDAEPIPAEGEVAAPEELSEEARGIWDRLARPDPAQRADALGLSTPSGSPARYRPGTGLVNGSSLLVHGPKGLTKNPALVVPREAEVTFA